MAARTSDRGISRWMTAVVSPSLAATSGVSIIRWDADGQAPLGAAHRPLHQALHERDLVLVERQRFRSRDRDGRRRLGDLLVAGLAAHDSFGGGHPTRRALHR